MAGDADTVSSADLHDYRESNATKSLEGECLRIRRQLVHLTTVAPAHACLALGAVVGSRVPEVNGSVRLR